MNAAAPIPSREGVRCEIERVGQQINLALDALDGGRTMLAVAVLEDVKRDYAALSAALAGRETGTGGHAWQPNTDYHNEATWPPSGHPLYGLFHNARLNWPHNMDSRAEYERIARWLAPPAPTVPLPPQDQTEEAGR